MFNFLFFTACAALVGSVPMLFFRVFALSRSTWHRKQVFFALAGMIVCAVTLAMSITITMEMIQGQTFRMLGVLWLFFIAIASAVVTYNMYKPASGS